MAVADEQVKPLAVASPANFSYEDPAVSTPYNGRRRRRSVALCCCGLCGAAVIVLGFIILVLSFTVFKIKDPVLTLNSLRLDSVNSVGKSVNATLTADVSVSNRNVAAFRFEDSATEFYYGGEKVGVGSSPSGSVAAHRTVRLNVTVEVLGDRVAAQPKLTAAIVAGGAVNLTSYTQFNGRLNVIGVYKRDIEVVWNCSMTLDLTQSAVGITDQNCESSVN